MSGGPDPFETAKSFRAIEDDIALKVFRSSLMTLLLLPDDVLDAFEGARHIDRRVVVKRK
jgi:hypothetical protein